MNDGVFMIAEDSLTVLHNSPYDSEDVLQQALADFPEVLAGGVTSGEGSRRLLLIRREKGVPTELSGASMFSLDHLFVDQAGVPVVVEVKRSSDTRIRREVVGQMLDYAANGIKYWPVADLRADYEMGCTSKRVDPDKLIEKIAPATGVEEFWSQVEQNLRLGRIRMVFVADRLPDELVRIIEFLNEQMSPAEVLGVEVQQFTNGTTRVLVPRVVGVTAAAKAVKERSTGTAWGEESMFATATEHATGHEMLIGRALIEHAGKAGTELRWGKGQTPGVSGWYPVDGESRVVWTLNMGSTFGGPRISLWLPELREMLVPSRFAAFVEQLSVIEPFRVEIESGAHKYPVSRLEQLTSDDIAKLNRAVESLASQAEDLGES